MNRFTKVGITVALIFGAVFGGAALSASAHNKSESITCTDYSVSLTSYDHTATAVVIVDGVTIQLGTFNGNYVKNGQFANATDVSHRLQIDVVSKDGAQYNLHYDQTVTNCYTPPLIPITDDLTITASGPTCDVPFNTVNYDIPVGLTVGGLTGSGSFRAEDFPATLQYTDQYVEPVVVTAGYSWNGPNAVTYGPLINPSTLVCVTPPPTPTPTPTPSVTPPVVPQELAETGSVPWGGIVFVAIALAVGGFLIASRHWFDGRGPGGTAVVTA